MNYETACRKIADLFEAQWNEATPVIYPNEVEDLGEVPQFARLTIRPSSGRMIAVGSRQHRRQGLVTVQIFVEQGTGQALMGALEEMATSIFEQANLSNITFFEAGADRVGYDGRGYYQSNVNASFQFDAN